MNPLPTTHIGPTTPITSASSTTLLALHGFGGGPRSFAEVAARLPRGLRAATLPGHVDVDVDVGVDSGADDPFAAAVQRVVDTVISNDHGGGVVLWGYSLGARLALAAALVPRARAALAGLILESGRAGDDDDADARAALDDERAQQLLADGVDAFFDRWDRGPLFAGLSAEVVDRRRSLRGHHDARRLAQAVSAFSPGRQRDLRPLLAELRLPTLLLAGEEDRVYRDHAKQMTTKMPDSQLFIVAGCGHIPHLEAPALVADAVATFIDNLHPTAQERAP